MSVHCGWCWNFFVRSYLGGPGKTWNSDLIITESLQSQQTADSQIFAILIDIVQRSVSIQILRLHRLPVQWHESCHCPHSPRGWRMLHIVRILVPEFNCAHCDCNTILRSFIIASTVHLCISVEHEDWVVTTGIVAEAKNVEFCWFHTLLSVNFRHFSGPSFEVEIGEVIDWQFHSCIKV